MGNAARKARKAAGIKFQHPVKEGTPLPMRSSQSRRSKINHMEVLLQNYTPEALGLDWESHMNRMRHDSQKKQHDEAELDLELDPKPFRIGRRRFVDYRDAEADDDSLGAKIEFSPRKKYEQDMIRYEESIFEASSK